jgi:hypothetical protein
LVTPVTARLKLDLHDLCTRKLDWDDPIPEELLTLWVQNLHDIQELRKIPFKRSIIPEDAANTNLQLIVSVVASEHIAVASVHSRVLLNNGLFHCQLVVGKSKIITGSTIPRAELKAATIGSILGHLVVSNVGNQFQSSIFVTDSTITLYWINQDDRPLQIAVRNQVIEIRRFTLKEQWYHVDTKDNIADVATRRGAIEDLSEHSNWQTGKPWMTQQLKNMPLRSPEQITLSGEEKRLAALELKAPDIRGHVLSNLTSKIGDRYSFSKYIVDPCVLPWNKSVRVFAFVMRFINNIKARLHKKSNVNNQNPLPSLMLQLSKEEVEAAENYFFRKGTLEVKQFAKGKDWKDCTVMKDKILYYTGRILDGQEVHLVEQNMLDLTPLTFVKPILDRFSPISYSIMIHAHQEETNHRNSISTLRESRETAFILRGRDLAEEIRESCVYCRRFKQRLVQVKMGNIHDTRLTIAPVFYNTQVDLMGPFEARCEHNHRSKVKVWGVVFKDPATSAVFVHAMQKYDTGAFLDAYTRFTSRFSHPNKLYIDEGSQLVKACKEMKFNILDITKSLNSKAMTGIEYVTCPVGGHNAHGMVERSIKEIKKLFTTVYSGLRLDIMSYETAFAWTSNELNNLPLCLGSKYVNLEHTDLITPSRLLFGRNNKRAPSGFCTLDKPSRLLEQMEMVEKSWWQTWKQEKLSDFIPKLSKWITGDEYKPKPGDIVIFTREESDHQLGSPVWRTGRIQSVERSADGEIRTVHIEYKNHSESVFRSTRRSVRKIAILHKEGDLELVEQLNIASKQANISYLRECSSSLTIKKSSE